jgi:hypothetical protein
LVHCVYSCRAVADDHPVMHVAGQARRGEPHLASTRRRNRTEKGS